MKRFATGAPQDGACSSQRTSRCVLNLKTANARDLESQSRCSGNDPLDDEECALTETATERTEWAPNWAVHPGAILEEHLGIQGLSQANFARLAGLTPKLVSTIIKGTNPITAETAIRLERVLGLKAHIWTGIQAKWDLFQACAATKPALDAKAWLARFPIKELQDRGAFLTRKTRVPNSTRCVHRGYRVFNQSGRT